MALNGNVAGKLLRGRINSIDTLILSAYAIAVKNGFEGTEEEWLESIKGKPGVDGKDGKDGKDGYTPIKGVDYFDGERGEPGLTTYVAMLEEQEMSFSELSWSSTMSEARVSAKVTLVLGEGYVVKYDGLEYVCECFDTSDFSGVAGPSHGLGSMDFTDCPFCIVCLDSFDGVWVYAHREVDTPVVPHTVGIYRFVRVPEDLLPEVGEEHNGKTLAVVNGKWKMTDGVSGEAISQMQKDIADLKYVPIDITNIANNVGTVEMGSSVDAVTVSWTLNKDPNSQTLDGEAVAVSETEKTITGSFSENKGFTLEVTDERNAKDTATTSISFFNGVYYGVLEDGAEVDSASILSMTRKLQGSKGISFTANAGATQRIVFALPTRYGTPNFNVGGFDGGFAKAKTFVFTNASGYTESYDVWLSDNVGLGSITVKVS